MLTPRLKAVRTTSGTLIFGRGLIAQQLFRTSKKFGRSVIVAAGVSDSSELQAAAYLREHRLLTKALRLKRTVFYFGSVGAVPWGPSRYYRHKFRVEKRVAKASKSNRVFCLPQVFGPSGNQHTLVNFFFGKLQNNERPTLQENVFRLLIPVKLISDLPRASSHSSLGSRISVLHNVPLTPEQLLAILESELAETSLPARPAAEFTRGFALRRSERMKGRRPHVLRSFKREQLESELRAYVRSRRVESSPRGSSL